MTRKVLTILAMLLVFSLSISTSDVLSDNDPRPIQASRLRSDSRINLPDLVLEKIETKSE